jgi:hypothetical protein
LARRASPSPPLSAAAASRHRSWEEHRMMELKTDESTEKVPGLRGVINRHPGVTSGAVMAVVVVSLAMALKPAPKPKAYFTVDDGKTFFEAPAQVPPFTYHGREAVRAVVYSCDGGKTRFVGYLLRHPPEEKAAAEVILARGGRMPPGEVKRPGDAEWASPFDPSKLKNVQGKAGFAKAVGSGKRYEEIIRVKCKDGGNPVIINPG